MMQFTAGTVIRAIAYFTDKATGAAANPTTVTFTYVIGNNAPVDIASGIQNPNVGEFFYDLDTTGFVTATTGEQLTTFQWAGEGSVQVVGARSVILMPKIP